MKLRMAFTCLVLIVTAFNLKAQPQVVGPTSLKVNEVGYYSIKNSPKGILAIHGVPERQKDNIRYLKALDDSPVVVVQLTESAIIVIITAVADESGKIQVASQLVMIGTPNWVPVPTPVPQPLPTPPDSDYFTDLKAAYLVSPDEEQRVKLKAVYESLLADLKTGKLASNSAAAEKLSVAAKPITLTALKKVNTDYLIKKVGRSTDKTKLVDALTTIIMSMEMLK